MTIPEQFIALFTLLADNGDSDDGYYRGLVERIKKGEVTCKSR